MPINKGSSNKAKQANIKAEIAADKPKKQAVAIASSEQKSAKAKQKKR